MNPLWKPVLAAVALLGVACNSGGGAGRGAVALNANVNLTGPWSVESTVASVTGPCDGLAPGIVPGNVFPVPGQLTHDTASGELVVDLDGDVYTSTLNGASFAYEESFTDRDGVTETFTLNLAFNAEGTSFTGTSRFRTVDSRGTVLCDLRFDVRGTRPDNSLTFLLEWETDHDIDLEVTEPDGTTIYYAFAQGGSSGGRHSGDANQDCSNNLIGMEQVAYASPQPGNYQAHVYVSAFTTCVGAGELIGFTLTVREPGSTTPTVIRDFVSLNGSYRTLATIPGPFPGPIDR